MEAVSGWKARPAWVAPSRLSFHWTAQLSTRRGSNMQRRDVGNEVIVALAAIGMLALALTFGVVLTLSRTVSNPTATGTAVAQGGTEAATLPGTAAAATKVTATTPSTHTTTPTAALNVALATGTSAATVTTAARNPTSTTTP